VSAGAVAHIRLSAIPANLEVVKSLVSDRKILAVIKSNAYGHGLINIARQLAGADGFGVTRLDEAISLRQAGITQPIVLLEGITDEQQLAPVLQNQLMLVIHNKQQLSILENSHHLSTAHSIPVESELTSADSISDLKVWLKLDTGMNRLGFSGAEMDEVRNRLAAIPRVKLQVVMSHLACADDIANPMTTKQIKSFKAQVSSYSCEKSLANSAGILAWPEGHFDWVRAGLMLYGVSPFSSPKESLGSSVRASLQKLKPVMTLKSSLISVKSVPKGESVGYGGLWVCPQDSLIGVVALGYGEGYPRHAKSGAPVLVNGCRCKVVGSVSMGMLCVELTDVDSPAVGDEVELWGENLPIEEVAEYMGVIPYELTTGLTERVEFEFE
jgi:alanine racemase